MCRAEAPHLSRVYQQFKNQGLVVLAVHADNGERFVSKIRTFVENKKLTHRILMAGNGVAMDKYFVARFPTTYWIDRNGKLVDRSYGYHGYNELRAKAEKLLKRGRQATSQ